MTEEQWILALHILGEEELILSFPSERARNDYLVWLRKFDKELHYRISEDL